MRSTGVVAAGLAAVLLSALFATPVGATTAPNYSIFFFMPGTEVTGTLQGGVYTQNEVISTTKHWDAAAVSRTTLFLYNRTTGAVETRPFTSGVLGAKKHTYTIGKGFDFAAASCDTVMLYKRSNAKVVTATLTAGAMGTRHATAIPYPTPFTTLSASCDSYVLAQQDNTQIATTNGTLTGGIETNVGSTGIGGGHMRLFGTTGDSYLAYGGSAYDATYGRLSAGGLATFSTLGGFGAWNRIAGTTDTLLFYNSKTGAEATSTLVNGTYTFVDGSHSFSTGWKLIAGGK